MRRTSLLALCAAASRGAAAGALGWGARPAALSAAAAALPGARRAASDGRPRQPDPDVTPMSNTNIDRDPQKAGFKSQMFGRMDDPPISGPLKASQAPREEDAHTPAGRPVAFERRDAEHYPFTAGKAGAMDAFESTTKLMTEGGPRPEPMHDNDPYGARPEGASVLPSYLVETANRLQTMTKEEIIEEARRRAPGSPDLAVQVGNLMIAKALRAAELRREGRNLSDAQYSSL